jgi:hypothetical protein
VPVKIRGMGRRRSYASLVRRSVRVATRGMGYRRI